MAFVYGNGRGVRRFRRCCCWRDLWRILTGQLSEADLVMIKGTEEKPCHRGLSRSLLGAMALEIDRSPTRLLVSGMALMWHLNLFDAQILAQNLIEGANSFTLGGSCRSSCWPARS